MAESKNILFLTHYFPPEVNAPANRTYEHAIVWKKLGANITIITNNPNHPHGRLYDGYDNKRLLKRENVDGLNVIRVKTYLTANKGSLKRTLNFLVYFIFAIMASTRVKKIDLIIATSPQFFCGFAGAVIKKIYKKPFVLEIRDLWPDSIVAVKAAKESIFIKFLRIIEKKLYNSATQIVVLTDSFKKHIISYNISSNKIVTIPNGVDLNRFDISKKHRNNNIVKNIDENKFIVSYIGTIGLAHGIENIVYAAQKLQQYTDIQLLIVGDGSRRDATVQLIKKIGLNNITILPLQTKKMIPSLINLSDIGLVTLINSKLFSTVIPSKIFEYMSMKKPIIIAVPTGEVTKIVEKNFCGLTVTPEDPEAIVNAILKLYNNNDLVNKMGLNGYSTVKKHFNREQLARYMYKKIISAI